MRLASSSTLSSPQAGGHERARGDSHPGWPTAPCCESPGRFQPMSLWKSEYMITGSPLTMCSKLK